MSLPTTIRLPPGRPAGHLAAFGNWMATNPRAIRKVQWACLALYLVLLVLPAVIPEGSASHERMVLLAHFVVWGLWWPGVMLSVMLMGRVWCGVFCPEGALTELASRRGLNRYIPRWLRWGGWPVAGFMLTTLYGQLIGMTEVPQAALLILGSSTAAALLTGWLYGKNKRVWCRYLCPVSGVFGLLARLSPLCVRVDPAAWRQYPQRTPAVNCPTLLNVRQLDSMAECHACGRCSGHRDAVRLAGRWPGSEIVNSRSNAVPRTSEIVLLLFGLIGMATAALQWRISPNFTTYRQGIANWLSAQGIVLPIESNAPWWLLAPQHGLRPALTWLDGASMVSFVALGTLLLGGSCYLLVRGAARLATIDWRRLALTLTPMAGVGLVLGLTVPDANVAGAVGSVVSGSAWWVGGLLAMGMACSLGLVLRMLAFDCSGWARCAGAFASMGCACFLIPAVWVWRL